MSSNLTTLVRCTRLSSGLLLTRVLMGPLLFKLHLLISPTTQILSLQLLQLSADCPENVKKVFPSSKWSRFHADQDKTTQFCRSYNLSPVWEVNLLIATCHTVVKWFALDFQLFVPNTASKPYLSMVIITCFFPELRPLKWKWTYNLWHELPSKF